MADMITHQGDTRAVAAPGPAPGRTCVPLALIAALAIALTSFISGIGTARADTPQWSVSHVYMNLTVAPGQSAQSQYYGLIRSLRNAAGHSWRNNVQMTQLDDIHALIRLDLTLENRTVQLWFTGNNLYLRGFTDPQGNTYAFNDYDLQGAMRPASAFSSGGDLLPRGQYFVLPYGSDYNAMTQAAGRGRDTMPISWIALNASFLSLANAPGTPGSTDTQSRARALMFMIQYTSESARFYGVYQVMYNIMGNVLGLGDAGRYELARYNGLPAADQEFENNWSQISQWVINLTNGRNPAPLYVGPTAGTLYNFNDGQNHLAEGIGMPSEVSTTGDWWRTEL
jgi:hypothetical protein